MNNKDFSLDNSRLLEAIDYYNNIAYCIYDHRYDLKYFCYNIHCDCNKELGKQCIARICDQIENIIDYIENDIR